MNPQNLMYATMRSSPSPHPQAYNAALDYGSQIPMMLAGGMYGHGGPQAMLGYSQAMRPGRRDSSETGIALRSPLLDEFRANKTRKWDLRVSLCVFYGILTFVHDGLVGHTWLCC
jgi:pumilio RNA-binding family